MNAIDLPPFDIDDDDLRRRLDAIAARAEAPVVDPMADLQRGRAARRRRRTTGIAAGLVAVAAASAFALGAVSGDVGTDASEKIANDPSPSPSDMQIPAQADVESRPEIGVFLTGVDTAMGGPSQLPVNGALGDVIFDGDEVSLITATYRLSKQVSLDVRAGTSRDVLEWSLAKDVSSYPVGDATGERGSFGGARDAYIFDQPDGDVVLVVVDGPPGQGPTTMQINALLTSIDVPDSQLTPAQAWQDTLLSIGLDASAADDRDLGTGPMYTDNPSVLADVYQSRKVIGQAEWQGQTVSTDTPDCPDGFRECGTMQVEGETFLAKYVAAGEREGWLYLERDHGGIRAQVILQPHDGAWTLPLPTAARMLLDERWSRMPAESSVGYPVP